jgi:3-isopropylmalate/(R)-2-methylmalate dehydratase small subunit
MSQEVPLRARDASRDANDESRFTFHALRFTLSPVAKYEDLRGDEDSLLAITGCAWVFGDRVTCEQVLAAKHLDEPPTVSCAFVMAALNPQFARAAGAGDFIVAGLEFAADATHRNVPAALRARGIGAVIARSFGPFFLRNATHIGLPALMLEETGAIRSGDRLRVDIEAHIVANLSSGDRYVIRNVDDDAMAMLRRSK